jgi:hypothetical protein
MVARQQPAVPCSRTRGLLCCTVFAHRLLATVVLLAAAAAAQASPSLVVTVSAVYF